MTPAPVGFDLDMTLIDARRLILESFARLAADTGVAIDPAGVDRRLGIKLRDELAHWFPPGEIEHAVRIYRRCRRAGVMPRGLIDCMIVAVALRHGATVLACDADLDRVSRVVGLATDVSR